MWWQRALLLAAPSLLALTRADDLPVGNDTMRKRVWHPAVGEPFQIVLSAVIDGNLSKGPIKPEHVKIFDVDLFDTSAETIQILKKVGKKVICYFSAGTSEDWRQDFNLFKPEIQGARLPMWPGEKWLDIRQPEIFEIMKKRIRLAYEKGCDAIDPDNMDGYDNERGGGFKSPLTAKDTIKYVKQLSDFSQRLGMAMGLKNALDVIPFVTADIQFAVNEECGNESDGCKQYQEFLSPKGGGPGKPVFHIEYVNRIPVYAEGKGAPKSPLTSQVPLTTQAPQSPVTSQVPITTQVPQSPASSRATQATQATQAPKTPKTPKTSKGKQGGGLFGGLLGGLFGGLFGGRPARGFMEDLEMTEGLPLASIMAMLETEPAIIPALPTGPFAASPSLTRVPTLSAYAAGHVLPKTAASITLLGAADTMASPKSKGSTDSPGLSLGFGASPESSVSPASTGSTAHTAVSPPSASAVSPVASPSGTRSAAFPASSLSGTAEVSTGSTAAALSNAAPGSASLPKDILTPVPKFPIATPGSTSLPKGILTPVPKFPMANASSISGFSFAPHSNNASALAKTTRGSGSGSTNSSEPKPGRVPSRYDISMSGVAGFMNSRMTADAIRSRLCVRRKPDLSRKMSTVIKVMSLDGWVMDCDGKEWETRATPLTRKIINSPVGAGGGGAVPKGPGGVPGGGLFGGLFGGGSPGGGWLGTLGSLFGGKANYQVTDMPLADVMAMAEREQQVGVDGMYARILAMPDDGSDPAADALLDKQLDAILAGVDLTTQRKGSAKERRGEAIINEALMEYGSAEVET